MKFQLYVPLQLSQKPISPSLYKRKKNGIYTISTRNVVAVVDSIGFNVQFFFRVIEVYFHPIIIISHVVLCECFLFSNQLGNFSLIIVSIHFHGNF